MQIISHKIPSTLNCFVCEAEPAILRAQVFDDPVTFTLCLCGNCATLPDTAIISLLERRDRDYTDRHHNCADNRGVDC